MSVYDDSVLHYVACAVGVYHDGRFVPERWVRLTYGPSPYAASFYLDEFGQPGLIAWLRGVEDPDGGWAGALTVPMLLSVEDQGLPVVRPHPHLARRRQRELPGGPDRAQWPVGAAVEVEWQPRDGLRDALVLTAADDVMVAEVSIVDRSLTLNVPASDVLSMPWPGGDIQLLLDGPVLEIFCGGMLMAAAVNPHHQELCASSSDGMPLCRYWMLASRSAPPGS
jgi:beta-fructofuranosidase